MDGGSVRDWTESRHERVRQGGRRHAGVGIQGKSEGKRKLLSGIYDSARFLDEGEKR